MRHTLIQRLFDDFDYPAIGLETHDAFVHQPGVNVLFFTGDPHRDPDTIDIAAALPELIQAFPGQLRPGVVEEAAEIELQQRYGFRAWPTLVFIRAGGYLGAITGIRSWSEYLVEIGRLLNAEAVPPPSIRMPLHA